MGQAGSREVVLTGSSSAASAAERERASARAAQLEEQQAAERERAFREGQRRGAEAALAHVEAEVERSAAAALARAQLGEELRRAELIEAEARRVEKALFRAPPRALECTREEGALVEACGGGAGAGGAGSAGAAQRPACVAAMSSYEACSEKLVQRLLREGPTAQKPA